MDQLESKSIYCDSIMYHCAALTMLVTNVPRQMVEYLPDVLSFVWHSLTTSAHAYVSCTVNCREHVADAVNSDGECQLMQQLSTFLSQGARR
jgi:hypothetical protein